jgi:hypothetical protein
MFNLQRITIRIPKQNYSWSRATQAQGEGVNIYTNTTGGANYMKAWVDWNNNRIFDESTEVVYQCTNAFINTTFGFKIPETTTQEIIKLN